MLNMPSNSLPDRDLNLQEMKTKSPICPPGGYHMYADKLFCQCKDMYILHKICKWHDLARRET